MHENENYFKRYHKDEAMKYAGWGSLSSDNTMLTLTIESKVEVLFEEMPQLNFHVKRTGYVTLNGNASHKIEILPGMNLKWHPMRQYQGRIIVAIVAGRMTDFAFALTADQILELQRVQSAFTKGIKLTAEVEDKKIIIMVPVGHLAIDNNMIHHKRVIFD